MPSTVRIARSSTPIRRSAAESAQNASNWSRVSSRPDISGMQALSPQDLGAIDVAEACDDTLIHDQLADRRAALGDARPGAVRIRIVAQHVGAEPAEELGDGVRVENVASGRPVAIDDMRGALHPDANRAARLGRRPLRLMEFPIEPEMDVQRVATGKAIEEMLAASFDRHAASPVEPRRAFQETPLRRRDRQYLAPEHRDLVARLAMDRMAFGHADALAWGSKRFP